ncbi:MAG: Fic family protein [Vicinamibacteria bacterium]
MEAPRLMQIAPSTALKERRLRERAGDGFDSVPALREAVLLAQARGSLELAGLADDASALAKLRQAQAAVDRASPLGLKALAHWHAAVTEFPSLFRATEATRVEGPPPAPPGFIESRLRTLEHWLSVESARDLKPAQAGALALARIVEVLPWDGANGRVARLAASHVMVRAGGRPPVLAGADAGRLEQALLAAWALQTEPLVRLLDEASERALDAMLAAL